MACFSITHEDVPGMDLLHFWEQVEASPPKVSPIPIHCHRLQGFCVCSAELVGIPGVSWQQDHMSRGKTFLWTLFPLGLGWKNPEWIHKKIPPALRKRRCGF